VPNSQDWMLQSAAPVWVTASYGRGGLVSPVLAHRQHESLPGGLRAGAPSSAAAVALAVAACRHSRRLQPGFSVIMCAEGQVPSSMSGEYEATPVLGRRTPSVKLKYMRQLERVDKGMWPLIMSAAAAECDMPGLNLGGLTAAIGKAANGLVSWREELSKGRIWETEDGADWPAEPNLRAEWTQLLRDLEMPRFTKKHPQLLDPLLASLLEMVERASREEEEERDESQTSRNQDDNENEDGNGSQDTDNQDDSETQDDGEAQDSKDQDDGNTQDVVGSQEAKNQDNANAARAQKLMQELRDQWEQNTNMVDQADDTFGAGGSSAVADGIGQGGDSMWHETAAWKELSKVRTMLTKNPDLRTLVRNLGRRSAVKGPLRELPEERYRSNSPQGVIKSNVSPSEASGICLSGDWETMLPSEAQLWASRRPKLRDLYHARRIERSLVSYERTAWLEEEARETGRKEMRPLGKAGPLIVCLDTSGSMQGHRELLGKALVVECFRQAHRQKRRCYLYAFSGKDELEELELSLTTEGLRSLLEFLKYSFLGGTDMDAALEASAARLELEEDGWRNADLLLITDGDVPRPGEKVMAGLEKACKSSGARVVGIVLAEKAREFMHLVCTDLYVTGDPRPPDGRSAGLGQDPAWPRLRKVPPRSKEVVGRRR